MIGSGAQHQNSACRQQQKALWVPLYGVEDPFAAVSN